MAGAPKASDRSDHRTGPRIHTPVIDGERLSKPEFQILIGDCLEELFIASNAVSPQMVAAVIGDEWMDGTKYKIVARRLLNWAEKGWLERSTRGRYIKGPLWEFRATDTNVAGIILTARAMARRNSGFFWINELHDTLEVPPSYTSIIGGKTKRAPKGHRDWDQPGYVKPNVTFRPTEDVVMHTAIHTAKATFQKDAPFIRRLWNLRHQRRALIPTGGRYHLIERKIAAFHVYDKDALYCQRMTFWTPEVKTHRHDLVFKLLMHAERAGQNADSLALLAKEPLAEGARGVLAMRNAWAGSPKALEDRVIALVHDALFEDLEPAFQSITQQVWEVWGEALGLDAARLSKGLLEL